MISFFESKDQSVFAVQTKKSFSENEIKKLEWLFGNATFISDPKVNRDLIGPRAAMVSPWSTNCLLYTSPSPRDRQKSRMPSSA